jgi:hypothetical protein
MYKFFIVGCPRSGTTMVQQALNRHPRVAIPPETKFFFSFLGHSRRQQRRHIERLDRDLGVRLPRPAAAVRSADEARAFYEVMARLYVERLGKPGVLWFGEKTPEHTGHLPRIRRLFPDAKVVVVERDGRDVAESLSRMPWASPDVYVNFAVWLYYHRVVRGARQGAWPNCHFVRYEDVVADPRRALGGVLDFLGLPYEPAVADGWGNTEGVPEREYPWKGRALGKITRDRVGAFRQRLTTEQVEILERLGGAALRELGYELLSDGRRPLPAGFLLGLSVKLSQFVYRLPWRAVLRELLSRSLPLPADRVPAPAPAAVAPALA